MKNNKIQEDKPYYIGERRITEICNTTILREIKNEELLAFLKSVSFRKSKAEKFCLEIQNSCRSITTFFSVMLYLSSKRRFLVMGKGKATEFTRLLKNLRYNTRAIEFNGHTAEELKVDLPETER